MLVLFIIFLKSGQITEINVTEEAATREGRDIISLVLQGDCRAESEKDNLFWQSIFI